MTSQVQARILHSRRAMKGWSMQKLADEVKHPRESVSRAVNQGKHPKVLKKVKEVLGV